MRYGERTHDEVEAICKDRAQQAVGFEDDPDFYGLGIRIGLYLQWTSALVTNWYTPTERKAVITTYIVFSISITVAILVKIFSRQCTFMAEMFVVLTMFWGGLNVVLLPLLHAALFEGLVATSNETTVRRLALRNRDFDGLKWSMSLLNYFMSPITIWFWTRLAAVGHRDFYSTPGGSSLYCFARIPDHSIRAFSIFMSIISTTNFVWFNYVSLPLRVDQSFEGQRSGICSKYSTSQMASCRITPCDTAAFIVEYCFWLVWHDPGILDRRSFQHLHTETSVRNRSFEHGQTSAVIQEVSCRLGSWCSKSYCVRHAQRRAEQNAFSQPSLVYGVS